MAESKKQKRFEEGRSFEMGTHPGAYVTNRDPDKNRLEFFSLVDRMDFIDLDSRKEIEKAEEKELQRSNSASPPAEDPPVPNRAHTEM